MAQRVVIQNPIINSPFGEPQRHFRFDDEGITDEVVLERRPSSYFVPIAQPKKKAGEKQLTFQDWTADRIEENKTVNFIRQRVKVWREGGHPEITPVTRRLLDHWTRSDRFRRLFFCQIEALETFIYITEVAHKFGDQVITNDLRRFAADANPELFRIAAKMATGSGKTVVMAMIIAWHTLNKHANPQDNGTVGPELVKEAAKEAVQGVGFDLLLVCGFAFDPHVTEESKRYGNLVVLPCRKNPDLAMGDDLLKKTGAGNLFMVFGEPDLDVTRTKDGQIVVEIRGVDVYDPTTGEIRSSSTDDIACWFIDTNYNGESFFVRHAYFTGAGEPYDKLKRALRAEADEDAWSQIYSTTSRPFPKPDTGKIAVKVINHYGDEVLKVYTT